MIDHLVTPTATIADSTTNINGRAKESSSVMSSIGEFWGRKFWKRRRIGQRRDKLKKLRRGIGCFCKKQILQKNINIYNTGNYPMSRKLCFMFMISLSFFFLYNYWFSIMIYVKRNCFPNCKKQLHFHTVLSNHDALELD